MTGEARGMLDRLLAVRIVRWPFKLLYIVGAYALGTVLLRGLVAVEAPPAVVAISGMAMLLLGVLYGTRVFRGRNEPLHPPRPLWQMSARPTASRRLRNLFAAVFALGLITVVVALASVAGGSPVPPILRLDGWTMGIGLVEYLVLAVVYGNSARLLTAVAPPPISRDAVSVPPD